MSSEIRSLLTLPINCASAGNNTVIPASPGVGFKIWKAFLVVAGNVNVTYQDGATPLSGPLNLVTNGSDNLLYDGTPWFTTSIGNAFVINLSAPVQVSGAVYYTRG